MSEESKFPFATYCVTPHGARRALAIVKELVTQSQWFEVTPLPHDKWRIRVKLENMGTLYEIVRRVP